MNATGSMLAIDVGNTFIKFGEFDWPANSALAGPTRVLRLASAAPNWDELASWLGPAPTAAYMISVCHPASDRLAAWFGGQFPECGLRLLRLEDFPLHVDVDFPERVGHDRLAAAVAARQLKTDERAAIVVDAGSAITLDMISPGGDFLGGAILPGWQIMARALATGTHLLPYVENGGFASAPEVVGRSTEKAIASGLYWGSLGAVRELMERMSAAWQPTPERLVAGGDLQMLVPYLGPHVHCVPDMVLRGVMQTVRIRGLPATPSR